MAGSKSHSFVGLLEKGYYIEEEEEALLRNGFSGTKRSNGPNSSMDLSGEPRGQSGFSTPIPRAQQIINPTPPLVRTNIGSSTPSLLITAQSRPQSLDYNYSGSTSSEENIHQLSATDLLFAASVSTAENARKIMKLALEAMEELRRMALDPGEPLWKLDRDLNFEMLNTVHYARLTGDANVTMLEIERLTRHNLNESLRGRRPENCSGSNDRFFESLYCDLLANCNPNNNTRSPRDNCLTEGSRDFGYIGMRPLEIVEILMNLEKWSQIFFEIVSKTTQLRVLASSGVQGNYEDTLQVLEAEFHFPGPLVPSRQSYMARLCKRLGQGLWGVVDMSLENLFEFSYSRHFRRRPSGCLIEQMPNGSSKVIWVENVCVDNSKVHGIFQEMVGFGLAFSAKRWVESLARVGQRSSTPVNTIVNAFADTEISIYEIGKRSILKLAERMVKRFLLDIGGSSTNNWIDISPTPNNSDPLLMSKKTYKGDPGKPSGLSTYLATSLGLPIPPNKIFDFLTEAKYRPMWDFMSFGRHSIAEVVRFKLSADPTNFVSLIQVKSAPDKVVSFYLQESHTNSLGTFIIYSELDPWSTSMILSGGDPEIVEILPSGFVIHSNEGQGGGGGAENSAAILTVVLHFIDQVAIRGITPRSIESMNSLLNSSITSIKKALLPKCLYLTENQGIMESNKRMRLN